MRLRLSGVSDAVFQKIKSVLDENKISYEVMRHEPVFTSEQAAKARGHDLNSGLKRGAKAMILKADDKFIQCIVPACLRVDMKKVRAVINAKKLRLASAEEVKEVIDCEPGSVPPFGSLFGLASYADPNLNDEIDFNAGLHGVSIFMKRSDWEKIVKPVVVSIASV